MKSAEEQIAEFKKQEAQEVQKRNQVVAEKEMAEAWAENERRDKSSNLIFKEIEDWNRKEDLEYLQHCKDELVKFSKLYLKHLDKPLYQEINLMVINDLKKELEEVNARLHGNKTNQRCIHYRLG